MFLSIFIPFAIIEICLDDWSGHQRPHVAADFGCFIDLFIVFNLSLLYWYLKADLTSSWFSFFSFYFIIFFIYPLLNPPIKRWSVAVDGSPCHLPLCFVFAIFPDFWCLLLFFFLTVERGDLEDGVNNFREYMLRDSSLGWTCSIVSFCLLFGLNQFQNRILLSSVIWKL